MRHSPCPSRICLRGGDADEIDDALFEGEIETIDVRRSSGERRSLDRARSRARWNDDTGAGHVGGMRLSRPYDFRARSWSPGSPEPRSAPRQKVTVAPAFPGRSEIERPTRKARRSGSEIDPPTATQSSVDHKGASKVNVTYLSLGGGSSRRRSSRRIGVVVVMEGGALMSGSPLRRRFVKREPKRCEVRWARRRVGATCGHHMPWPRSR